MSIQPFHLAIPVKDLESTRNFYGNILELKEGRSCDKWIDWNFFSHQLSTHLKPEEVTKNSVNDVDNHKVPVRHFGVVLSWNDWHKLSEKLQTKNIDFLIKPYIRFKGKTGEQATMFFLDPSNNALEFKAFKNISSLFATNN